MGWLWSLTLFYLLLSAPQAQSDGKQRATSVLRERLCCVETFQTSHQEECRTAECPQVSNSPAAERAETETSSEPVWPTWPPSQDCRRCSRQRYRSANQEKCKNCPEGKVTKGEKNKNKKKKKNGRNKKKDGKKGN